MPAPSGSTAKYGLPYLLETDVPDVATASQDLAQGVENIIATAYSGTAASRPAAGTSGRFYYATDTGELTYDNGTTWVTPISGTPAGRLYSAAAQTGFVSGTVYAATYGSTSFTKGGMTVVGNTLIAPVTGIYDVIAVATFSGPSGGSSAAISEITIAGGVTSVGQAGLETPAYVSATARDLVGVTAGQAIGANASQTSGSTIGTFGGSAYDYLAAVLVTQ